MEGEKRIYPPIIYIQNYIKDTHYSIMECIIQLWTSKTSIIEINNSVMNIIISIMNIDDPIMDIYISITDIHIFYLG